jgi:hypothetical protein
MHGTAHLHHTLFTVADGQLQPLRSDQQQQHPHQMWVGSTAVVTGSWQQPARQGRPQSAVVNCCSALTDNGINEGPPDIWYPSEDILA